MTTLWLVLGSLPPGLCVAFAAASRLGRRVPARWARLAFLVTAGLATVVAYRTLRHVDEVTTTLVVAAAFGYALMTASVGGLMEDNAPPTPEIRAQILARHTAVPLRYRRRPGKRAFDLVVASIGIVVTLPLWFLVALLIWFEEPGPVFFVKNSVGRGGIAFRELKFRSMRYGAEEHTGVVVATRDDPRTLAVGRSLRHWHLDELPELLNVLAGTMSLVGPRPLRAVVVSQALAEVPGFADRHAVRPGIACTAQIEKCHVAPAERLLKDLEYIQRMGLIHDVRMLVRAVVTTVRGEREPAPGPESAPAPVQAVQPVTTAGPGEGPVPATRPDRLTRTVRGGSARGRGRDRSRGRRAGARGHRR